MDIMVKNPSEKHIEQMLSLADEARQHHIDGLGGYFKPLNPEIELNIIRQYMQNSDGGHIIVVAVDAADNAVGMILGDVSNKPWLESARVAHVGNLIVAGTARRCGVGKKLMDAFVAECKKRDVQEVTLGVYNKNKGSYNFYIEYGFEPLEQKMSIKL